MGHFNIPMRPAMRDSGAETGAAKWFLHELCEKNDLLCCGWCETFKGAVKCIIIQPNDDDNAYLYVVHVLGGESMGKS